MKKLVSLLLILAMAIFPGITAYAAVPADVTMLGAVTSIDYNSNPYLEDIDLRYDRVFEFPLTADMFGWEIVGAELAGEPVTRGNISHNRVTVRTAVASGVFSSIFEAPTIVYKSSRASGNQTTATVQIKVRSGATVSSKKTFGATIYLSINGSRDSASEYYFSGSVMPGGGTDISDGDYVDISDGKVLQPSQRAREVELYLGEGITIKTNLVANKKYSGTAQSQLSSADERLMRQYPSIDNIITVRQSGLDKGGNYVSIDVGQNYYVYNADRKYIGRTASTLPFSNKYYLSTKQINMGGTHNPAPAPRESDDDHISRESALSQTKLALSSSKTASVQYKDADCVLVSTLQEMNAVAAKAGGTVKLIVDTTAESGAVQGRITISTASTVKLIKNAEIDLGVFTDNDHTSSLKADLGKYYTNKMAVISLAHQGPFGMRVHIDARVDLGSMKTSSLYLYSYDKATNTIRQIKESGISVDKNGYVHFNTNIGGDIIVTDSVLKKR